LLVGDLNGDGKVDIEDAKIALEKAKQVGPMCFIISCLTPINPHLKYYPSKSKTGAEAPFCSN
jgi:hypothetical protein